MQPRPGQRPRALARSAARRAGLALDNAARTYAPENLRVREFGNVTATLVTPEVRAAADDARAAERAAFSPLKSTGRISLAGPLVRCNMPRAGGVREIAP